MVCNHEGVDSVISEVAASFIFEFDGKMNPFLPGLDDNMFSGKRVELPLVYIVLFEQDKIRDIRVFWDQATVLKQIEVIGARGRGWPVYDGPEQSRLLKQGAKPETRTSRPASGSAPGPDMSRPTAGTHDPHASLNLYAAQPNEERGDFGPQDYQERRQPDRRNVCH